MIFFQIDFFNTHLEALAVVGRNQVPVVGDVVDSPS